MRPMDDAALVEAARSGDGSAWADIYDRYADKLHDHCHRILRDRDDAADALHDAFIAAARNLHQLRDPARLRPWLYSICRHEALRRVRQRSRDDLTDEVDDMSSVEIDMDEGSRSAELQELVWAAAAGLSARDQALLDLNVRQGLEGQDLADAMGTSLNNSYVMLSRLRDQVERSLGALLIARLGRDDCDELDGLLADWDGRFSPLLRKRVARHVDRCEVCSERRAAVVSPMALLAAAPLVPAPGELRSRVLDRIGSGGATTDGAELVRFSRAGFAAAERGDGVARRGWLVAAVVVLVAGLLGGVLATQGDEPDTLLAVAGDTTTTTIGVTTSEAPATTTTTTTAPTTTTTSAPEVAPPPSNPDAPPSTDAPTVVPPPPTTPPDTTPPEIVSVTQLESVVFTVTCSSSLPRRVNVTAEVTDAAPLTVVLRWGGPPGSGSVPMTRSGDVYSGSFGDFVVGGVATYVVEATDAAGHVTTSAPGSVNVTPC